MEIISFEQFGPVIRITLRGVNGVRGLICSGPKTGGRSVHETELPTANFSLDDSREGISVIEISVTGLAEPDDREGAILLTAQSQREPRVPVFIELVRQSEDYLFKTFGFSKVGGYWILGPRSDDFQSPVSHLVRPVTWYPAVTDFFHPETLQTTLRQSVETERFEAVRVAVDVLHWLLGLPINTGPADTASQRYYFQKFSTKLKMLIDNQHSVQCSGFRDLFVQAVASRGVKVRAVDANNYPPPVS